LIGSDGLALTIGRGNSEPGRAVDSSHRLSLRLMFLHQKLTEQCSQPMEDVAKLRVHAHYPAGFAVLCFLVSGQGDVARRARSTLLVHAQCSAPDGALLSMLGRYLLLPILCFFCKLARFTQACMFGGGTLARCAARSTASARALLPPPLSSFSSPACAGGSLSAEVRSRAALLTAQLLR
jgi:hypothetical protein